MSIGAEKEEERNYPLKQWDAVGIDIAPVRLSYWGLPPEQMPPLLQWLQAEGLPLKAAEKTLLTYNDFTKLVAQLHKKGFDTSRLTEAVEQAIKTLPGGVPASADTQEEEAASGMPEKELFRQLQQTLASFSALNPTFRVRADGVWGPVSQQALDTVLQSYRLPLQKPSENLLEQLQTILSRIVRLGCTDVHLVAALKNNPFCVIQNTNNEYKMEPKDEGGILERVRDGEKLIEFPKLDDHYLNGDHYTLFSGWLMLLSLTTEKPYDDFCDLWVKQEEDAEWQSIERPSAQEQKEFVVYPDALLQCHSRSDVALSVKFIPRTNFDIDVIAVSFSSRLQFRISRGEEIKEAAEIGRQRFFAGDNFFEESDHGQKALANPLVKTDFVKLFVVRRNRVLPLQGESSDDGDNLSGSFYRLITAPPEALLATVTVGLDFENKQSALEDFKKTVEKSYADNPVTVHDDLQKGRWGGQNHRNGLQLTATVTKAPVPGFYSIEAWVHSAYNVGVPLSGHVAFFLHDTFPNEIEYVRAKDGVATLAVALCYEAFTLAAYAEDGTTLELDLNKVTGYPKGFYWNDLSAFQDRVIELYGHKPVSVKDDLQKGRWGGSSNVNGIELLANVVNSWLPGYFSVQLIVKVKRIKSFKKKVAFFLPDTTGRQIRFVPVNNGEAKLRIRVRKAFTAGAYTGDGTELELDLNKVQGFPEGFYRSEHAKK